METTIEASSTPIDENKPLVSGNVESDEKQTSTPDPRWPYLNRWSSNLGKDDSTQAVSELVPHPPTVTVEASSGASPTENAEEAGQLGLEKDEVSTDQTILAPPATSDKETGELPSTGSPSFCHELRIVDEKSPPPDRATDSATDLQEELDQEPVFVRSLGAWSKPLHFSTPPTPSEPATPKLGISEAVKIQIASFWPSIDEVTVAGHKNMKGKMMFPEKAMSNLPVGKIPPPALRDDGSLRFPWAARMNQSARNLFRAAEPTYLLDGTPQVTIPSKVLRLGPENKEEYIMGQFHRCSSPPGGLIHAVLNRLWGRECRITCKKLGDSSFLFHIPHENTRKWVIQRGVWHVDDCLLFVAPWSPASSLKIPEISTLPVWVNLKNIPDSCFSRLGISHIASGLGEPMLTHKPRLDPTSMGEAKILVEVELDKSFPKLIALDDKQGNIYMVDVEYTWIPSACERCGALGHKEKRCLLPSKPQDPAPAKAHVTNEEVPLVEIDKLLQNSFETLPGALDNSSLTTAHQAHKITTNSFVTAPLEVPTPTTLTHSHEVHPTSCSKIENTLSMLAVENAARPQSHAMEEIPSKVIILESSQASENEQSVSHHSPITNNHQQFHMERENLLTHGKNDGFDEILAHVDPEPRN
ncbi:hypothetical protein Bca101_023154 [Brassica carinata]